MSNEKQLALGVLQYVQDYDETFMAQANAIAPNWGWQETWPVYAQPYMKNYGVFKCPSDSHDETTWNSGPASSYVANGVLAYDNGWKFIGVINAGRSWFESTPRAMSGVNRPAETIVFAERHKMSKGSWMGTMEGSFSPWATVLMGPDGVDCNAIPGQQQGADGKNCSTWSAPDPKSDGSIATIHSGMSNFAFVDGHVKAMKPRQTVDADPTKYGNTGAYSGFFKMWDATRK